MKSVLISINPKWCELIASGKKIIEVRKSAPKEVPFKAYIYCTNPIKRFRCNSHMYSYADYLFKIITTGDIICGDGIYEHVTGTPTVDLNGKVIGEFICDRLITIDCDSTAPFDADTKEYIDKECCLGRDEIFAYANGKKCIGLHISDLVIYDKPRELSEFETLRKCDCCKSGYCVSACKYDEDCRVPTAVTRPPQSWMYAEERHGAQ